jgi:nucleotide-binding universal stress UspA family protein
MTIGLIALRAAKDQLVAAIATIKDELKNPDIAENVKYQAFNIGADLDEHLTSLGKIVASSFAAQEAAAENYKLEGGLHLIDPTQENGLFKTGIVLDTPPSTEGNPALEPGIDAPVPSPEVLASLEAANHNDPDSDSNQGHGEPSAEDLDKVAEEDKAAAATGAEHHKGLGERIKEIGKELIDGAGNAIGEAKFGD